jgi:hypothetical protein
VTNLFFDFLDSDSNQIRVNLFQNRVKIRWDSNPKFRDSSHHYDGPTGGSLCGSRFLFLFCLRSRRKGEIPQFAQPINMIVLITDWPRADRVR